MIRVVPDRYIYFVAGVLANDEVSRLDFFYLPLKTVNIIFVRLPTLE